MRKSQVESLNINLIYVSKMSDAGVKTVFEKETCRMVRGVMVLLRVVLIGTLYKILGSTFSDVCDSSIIPKIGFEEEKTIVVSKENIMLWHQILGHIVENGILALHGKGM
jgi:hypothetical protein